MTITEFKAKFSKMNKQRFLNEMSKGNYSQAQAIVIAKIAARRYPDRKSN